MHNDAEDRLEDYCEMSEDEQDAFFTDHERIAQFKDRLNSLCEIENEDERDAAIEDFVKSLLPEVRDEIDMSDKYSNKGKENLGEKFAIMCEMDEDGKSRFMEMVSDLPDDIREKLATFCDMSKEDQRAFVNSLHERMNEFKDEQKAMIREMQERHKELSDDKAKYEKFCKMSEGQRIMEIEDPERLAEISEWCDMTPEERMNFAKEHHEASMDFKDEHMSALDRMKTKTDLSPRLRAMILDDDEEDQKTSELQKELREKIKESDEKRTELKEKFRELKSEMKSRFSEISDERKSEIKERHKEMMAFKEELRLKSDTLTVEEKQELRAQFIEQAKDMQLAWITPRDQVSAGIEPDQIECREGYSLVMKNSNGLPMCVTAKTAIKMIEKGYAVPIEFAN